jgi:cbb3-type cytochrome oxidase subunit 1
MTNRLLKIAALYFVVAVLLGVYMGASNDHTLLPVHAHLNLLGWVSLAIIGLIYARYPALGETKLARIHFWLHNIGLPPLMLGVAYMYSGNPEIGGPVSGVFSIVVWLGILCFAVNLWRGLSTGK